jgi:hypothetical protein
MHNQSFWDYCYGKMDIYYLQKNLEARPQLNDTVEADLPLECALLSDQGIHLDISLSSSSVVSLLSQDTTTDATSVTPTNQLTTQQRTNTKKNKGTAKRSSRSNLAQWLLVQSKILLTNK